MKGLDWVDPTKRPHDTVVLLSVIGWIVGLVYALNVALDLLEKWL